MLDISNFATNLSDILNRFNDILYTCGKCCLKKSTCKFASQLKWFDSTCKELKYLKNRELRIFRRSRCESNLNAYVTARNEFKSYCNTKRMEYFDNQLNKLIDSANNPKIFWRKLKYMCSKAMPSSNSISPDESKTYFENLFDLNVDFNIEEPTILLGNSENEIEDYIFNSEITDEEILRAVKGLKTGTSSVEDNIVLEFFIHA